MISRMIFFFFAKNFFLSLTSVLLLLSVPSRLKEFKSSLFAVFQSAHAQSVKMTALMEDINKGRESRFSEPEVRSALGRMQDDNQIMVADDIIFLIWALMEVEMTVVPSPRRKHAVQNMHIKKNFHSFSLQSLKCISVLSMRPAGSPTEHRLLVKQVHNQQMAASEKSLDPFCTHSFSTFWCVVNIYELALYVLSY